MADALGLVLFLAVVALLGFGAGWLFHLDPLLCTLVLALAYLVTQAGKAIDLLSDIKNGVWRSRQ